MKILYLASSFAALIVVLAACTSVENLPGALQQIKFVAVNSPDVEVEDIHFLQLEGKLSLRGKVEKAFKGGSTVGTHLDVRFLDAGGRVLRELQSGFEPNELPARSPAHHPHGHFIITLPDVPAGTMQIEVAAHTGAHPSPQN